MYVPQCETFMEKCNIGEEISAAGDRPTLTAATILRETPSGVFKTQGMWTPRKISGRKI
jgi:hypothetical protein